MNIVFSTSSGLRGHYAIVYDQDSGECIQTGIGSYEKEKDAIYEAYEWAVSENYTKQAEELLKRYNKL